MRVRFQTLRQHFVRIEKNGSCSHARAVPEARMHPQRGDDDDVESRSSEWSDDSQWSEISDAGAADVYRNLIIIPPAAAPDGIQTPPFPRGRGPEDIPTSRLLPAHDPTDIRRDASSRQSESHHADIGERVQHERDPPVPAISDAPLVAIALTWIPSAVREETPSATSATSNGQQSPATTAGRGTTSCANRASESSEWRLDFGSAAFQWSSSSCSTVAPTGTGFLEPESVRVERPNADIAIRVEPPSADNVIESSQRPQRYDPPAIAAPASPPETQTPFALAPYIARLDAVATPGLALPSLGAIRQTADRGATDWAALGWTEALPAPNVRARIRAIQEDAERQMAADLRMSLRSGAPGGRLLVSPPQAEEIAAERTRRLATIRRQIVAQHLREMESRDRRRALPPMAVSRMVASPKLLEKLRAPSRRYPVQSLQSSRGARESILSVASHEQTV